MSIADPRSLRRELDARMKKVESEGNDYHWLEQKKYPAALGLMVDYICSSFEHRKPTSTATPKSETVPTQEANEKYRAFFFPGSLSFTFGKEVKTTMKLRVPITMLSKASASSMLIGN